MSAAHRGLTQGVRRSAALLIAVVLCALLASGAIGYMIRAVTTPGAVTTAHSAPAAAAGNPVGDRWWQETGPASITVSRDAWWEDMR